MMDWVKNALSESDGTPSSSRVTLWVTTGCLIFSVVFASTIIAHSYFVRDVIPDTSSILALYLGGGVGTGMTGAATYWANKKYGYEPEDDIPAHPTIE